MRTLKSILFEDDLDTGRLIQFEDEVLGTEDERPANDRASSYSDYQEPDGFFQTESDQTIAETESFNLVAENETSFDGQGNIQAKSFVSFASEKYEVLSENPEMFFPDTDKNGDMKRWSLLLRCSLSSGQTLQHHGKIWRPVSVKLEESTLKFHAKDFESSPPFKVINLTWYYSSSAPGIKVKLFHKEFLFTTVLVNAFLSTHGRLTKTRSRSNEVKLGCANYTVLADFVNTVQKCVASFPAFRPAGISYRSEKVTLRVKDTYHVVQQEKYNVTEVDQEEPHNLSSKQVEIMLKAKVSASQECSIHVKHSGSFSKKPAIDDVGFHKCVNSRSLNNQTAIARFLPLDNCWFQVMAWSGRCSKPTPLRCEVTVTIYGDSSVQIHACLFTGSTRLEVKSANNITLRFYIPSEWLKTGKATDHSIHQCTDVTKGNVSYSSNAETMLWSIPKLSFNPYRNFYLNGKPLATLNTKFRPPPCSKIEEFVKVPLGMVFYTKGNAQSSEVAITSMKLGLKSFGKFKTSYTSVYHVTIPLTASTG